MSEETIESNSVSNAISPNFKNWGAFFLTPAWLVRNGFLLTFIIYLALSWAFGIYSALPFSFIFLFFGSKWSWGKGNRWNTYQEFVESQKLWNIAGFVIFIAFIAYATYTIYVTGLENVLRLLRLSYF